MRTLSTFVCRAWTRQATSNCFRLLFSHQMIATTTLMIAMMNHLHKRFTRTSRTSSQAASQQVSYCLLPLGCASQAADALGIVVCMTRLLKGWTIIRTPLSLVTSLPVDTRRSVHYAASLSPIRSSSRFPCYRYLFSKDCITS